MFSIKSNTGNLIDLVNGRTGRTGPGDIINTPACPHANSGRSRFLNNTNKNDSAIVGAN